MVADTIHRALQKASNKNFTGHLNTWRGHSPHGTTTTHKCGITSQRTRGATSRFWGNDREHDHTSAALSASG